MQLPNLMPGFIASYDAATRVCRVRIPGVTDGGDVFPVAEFNYPIGANSEATEIRVAPGDRVWLAFVNGDPRHPIVMGYRPKEVGNVVDTLRMAQKNIELAADTNLGLAATGGNLTAQAGGGVHVTANGQVLIEGASIILRSPSITLDGPVTATNTMSVAGVFRYLAGMVGLGIATSNGKNVSNTHKHGNVQNGTGETNGVS